MGADTDEGRKRLLSYQAPFKPPNKVVYDLAVPISARQPQPHVSPDDITFSELVDEDEPELLPDIANTELDSRAASTPVNVRRRTRAQVAGSRNRSAMISATPTYSGDESEEDLNLTDYANMSSQFLSDDSNNENIDTFDGFTL